MIDNIENVSRISLDPSNLYSSGTQIVYTSGIGRLARPEIEYIRKESDRYHTVKIEDTITRIAYEYYGEHVERSPRYWWVIAIANPEIKNPLDLTAFVGTEIVIPDILNFNLINR